MEMLCYRHASRLKMAAMTWTLTWTMKAAACVASMDIEFEQTQLLEWGGWFKAAADKGLSAKVLAAFVPWTFLRVASA